MVCYVNKYILNSNMFGTIRAWGVALVTFILIAFVSRYIQPDMSTYGKLFAVCIPYSLSVVAVYTVTTSLGNLRAFRLLVRIIKSFLAEKKR